MFYQCTATIEYQLYSQQETITKDFEAESYVDLVNQLASFCDTTQTGFYVESVCAERAGKFSQVARARVENDVEDYLWQN